jgi:hypothetical protein
LKKIPTTQLKELMVEHSLSPAEMYLNDVKKGIHPLPLSWVYYSKDEPYIYITQGSNFYDDMLYWAKVNAAAKKQQCNPKQFAILCNKYFGEQFSNEGKNRSMPDSTSGRNKSVKVRVFNAVTMKGVIFAQTNGEDDLSWDQVLERYEVDLGTRRLKIIASPAVATTVSTFV